MAVGGGKDNSKRKFKGSGPRPDRPDAKRIEAVERNQAYSQLSVKRKLEELDRRLGKGLGARKQQARLAKLARAAA
jgi:hypothetical protein